MARKGTGFFDARGHFFKSPEEATVSDLASILGKIGDGESLAPGIACTLLDRRGEIERRPAVPDEQSPLSSLVERRSLEDFPSNP